MPHIAAIHFASLVAIFLVCGVKSALLIIDPKGTACVGLFDRVVAYTATVGSLVAMMALLSQRL